MMVAIMQSNNTTNIDKTQIQGGENLRGESYDRFADLLRQRGVTSYLVSKETGINPSVLTRWKQGTSKPKVDKLIKIADFLGCPLETLL